MKIHLKACILAVILYFGISGCTNQQSKDEVRVRNIIFLIGDGMGLTHISAAMISNNNAPLHMERAKYVGISKTHSANSKITDSAAAATALATGEKTSNRRVGTLPDGSPAPTILEKASQAGYATGIVATYAVTNATPAGFLAHVENRAMEEEIASQIIHSGVDVCFAGGKRFFTDRSDKRNLVDSLVAKGYQVIFEQEEIETLKGGKVFGLLADKSLPKMSNNRGDFLPRATNKALELLNEQSEKGFFIMIEGSQIDGAGHSNNVTDLLNETLDFDEAVGVAFDFADRNPGTLVVVTADHETGGLFIQYDTGNNPHPNEEGVEYCFASTNHTATMVPVFAYGTGAEAFSRVLDNTDLPKIMCKFLGLP